MYLKIIVESILSKSHIFFKAAVFQIPFPFILSTLQGFLLFFLVHITKAGCQSWIAASDFVIKLCPSLILPLSCIFTTLFEEPFSLKIIQHLFHLDLTLFKGHTGQTGMLLGKQIPTTQPF